MSWTPRFREAIAAGYGEPRYLLEEVRLPTGDRLGERWAIQSHAGPNPQLIGADVADTLGSYIVAPGWSARIGQFSVPLSGDIGWLLDRITRGQVVRLRMGFRGWREYEYEPIALGVVWNIRGSSGRWTLECRDALALLGARRTINGTKAALFGAAGTETTLAGAYSPGNTSIVLTSAATFAVPVHASAPGAVVVTPNAGDAFVLTYSGVSGNTLTGVSAAAVYGTTAAAANSGNIAAGAAWLNAHPAEIAARILVSTGTPGLHGAYDRLPETWGYALPPSVVDAEDFASLQPWGAPSSGAATWQALAVAAQENGATWLQSELAAAGHYLTVRQGRITVRPVPVPQEIGTYSLASREWPESADEITDADVVRVARWEGWAQDYAVEYRQLRVASPGGTTSRIETIATAPAVSIAELDLGARALDNESGWRTNIARRLGPWYARVPELLEIECAGHRLAHLAPGDVVAVSTDLVPGRLPTTEGGYRRRRVVVSGVSPQWFGASTIITGYALPTKQDGF